MAYLLNEKNRDWLSVHLADIVEIIGGGTPKTSIPEYWDGGIPWLSVNDFAGDSRYVDSAAKSISDEGLQNSSTKLLQKDDIIISARGTVGELAQLVQPMAFNQSCFGVRAIPGYLDQNFLFYLLRFCVDDMRQRGHGSVFLSITRDTFKAIDVLIPTIAEQGNIASVLGAFDDKIATNQKVIKKILELIFCLSSCRDGVEAKLEDIAEFISRGVVPKYAEERGKLIINQRCIRGGLVDLSQARWTSILPKDPVRLVHQYDVLINSTGQGTLGRMAPWIRKSESDNEVVTDTHITTVRFNPEKVNPAFAAIVLASRESAMANLAEGSTGQTELKRELVRNFKMNLPSLEVQNEISSAFHSLFAVVVAMEDENGLLIRTRDELLPLLMSGKISVREAEEAVSEVCVEKRGGEDNVQ